VCRTYDEVVFRWVVDSIVESVMESFDTDGDDTMDFKDFTRLVRSC
jgi:Ca2+-binding EF-hand superfamily protein